MLSFKPIVFAALWASRSQAESSLRSLVSRGLSQELIAGYEPQSAVTDHNAIDLDQFAMEEQLGKKNAAALQVAKAIYEQGGNSKSFAELSIPDGLPITAVKGEEVSGVNANGDAVFGTVYETAQASAGALKVQYSTSSSQASYSDCQVGALVATNTVGCFADTGAITVDGSSMTYEYIVATDNNNGRTLQGFSTGADSKMRVDGTGDYYEDFQKFVDYYGDYDYSDDLIQAAFSGTSVDLNGKTFDFSTYSEVGKGEMIKKTSAYTGVAMYALRELEDALDDCAAEDSTRNEGSVKALDEGVAFYTGSLEGTDGSGDGVFLYALADKRCANFKTCGENADSSSGTANVNLEIFKEFDRMGSSLSTRSCDAARVNKEKIAKKMFVPMVQGALRYAYIQEFDVDSAEKQQAEGAAFSASVLPIVAACNSDDAQTIYSNMKPSASSKADFSSVKWAFEKNYACMGITCEDVGGLWNAADSEFFDNAHPCNSGGLSKAAVIGLSVGPVVALIALALLFIKRRRSSTEVEFKSGGDDVNQV